MRSKNIGATNSLSPRQRLQERFQQGPLAGSETVLDLSPIPKSSGEEGASAEEEASHDDTVRRIRGLRARSAASYSFGKADSTRAPSFLLALGTILRDEEGA